MVIGRTLGLSDILIKLDNSENTEQGIILVLYFLQINTGNKYAVQKFLIKI